MSKRRRLGTELRELREARNLTLLYVAGQLGWSHTKLSRLETGKVRPDVGEIMDLLDVLDVTGEKFHSLVALARQANARGWWLAYQGMPARQAGFAEMESDVVSIRDYALVFIPGLLQTEAYMRQRFADGDAFQDFDLTSAVEGRRERQKVLGQLVEYEAVIDESALRRHSAPPAVRREQLRHLVELAAQPNVTLRALRLDAEIEYLSGALVSFALYRFAVPDHGDLVSVETETSDLWLGDTDDLARYTLIYNRVRAAAITPEQTVDLLRALAEAT